MDSGNLYSNMGPGMLGLEMSLHHQIPQQNTHHHMHQQPPSQSQSQSQPQPPSHHPIVSYAHQENFDNQQQALRQVFPFGNNKAKNQSLNFSDDDEPVPGVSADNNSTDDGKRNGSNKTCPWQRMKWTDNMVRLLILMVYYVGDEVGSEGNNNMDPSGKKKSGSGGGVGVLQKKGKWKSVSRAMMERGFYVSPQQCEDKFNDLNKRYKRVNDILGKGTSCRVVENQKLLDTMELSPKMKEEVKKLLNSKHLFFREMCAYHNSCGHNSGGGASGSGVANSQPHQNQLEQQQQQQRCLHSSENANANARIGASLVEGPKVSKGASGDNEDEEDEDDEDEDEEDDDDEVSGARGHDHDDHHHSHDEADDLDERSRKRQRKLGTSSPMVQQFCTELANVVQDRGRSLVDKRQWMKTKMMQLEEQEVSCLSQAFELQKQRLKWKKFISKKEREMEREKLINERKKLQNERMVLLLKQKELELLDYHQHHPNNNNRNSDPSSVTG